MRRGSRVVALVAAGFVGASAASAASTHKVTTKFRGELDQRTVKPEAGDSTTTSGFRYNEIRLGTEGQAAKNTQYKLDLRFDKEPVCKNGAAAGDAPTCATKSANGVSRGVDYAYVEQKLWDAEAQSLSLRFGRQAPGTGGVFIGLEGDDKFYVINRPMAYQKFDRADGASLSFATVEKQVATLYVLNPVETEGEGKTFSDKGGFAVGFGYKAGFMNGMINPVLSYHTTPKAKDEAKGLKAGKDTYLFAGTQFKQALNEQSAVTASLDYALMTAGKQTSEGKDLKTTGMGGSATYSTGSIRPVLKYWVDKPQVLDAETGNVKDGTKSTQMGFVVEVTPADSAMLYYAGIRTLDLEKVSKTQSVVMGVAMKTSAVIKTED